MKRKNKIIRHKSKLLLAAFICTALCICASTLAWFATTDAKENNFKTDFRFEVALVDEFTKPDTFEPNQLVPKKVSAANTGDIDAFVRLLVLPVAVKEGVPLPVEAGVEVIFDQLNETNWRYGEDGYYYYLGKLAPGEEAPALFTGVTVKINGEQAETYKDATFKIEVKSEGVDARKNEYRYSWWGNRDSSPTTDPLKTIDETLQTTLSN